MDKELPTVIFDINDEGHIDNYHFLVMTPNPIYAIYVKENTYEPIRVYIAEGTNTIPDKFFTDEKEAYEHLLKGIELYLKHIKARAEAL